MPARAWPGAAVGSKWPLEPGPAWLEMPAQAWKNEQVYVCVNVVTGPAPGPGRTLAMSHEPPLASLSHEPGAMNHQACIRHLAPNIKL
jgi:hypothetical protein